jgi:hypothetical protein
MSASLGTRNSDMTGRAAPSSARLLSRRALLRHGVCLSVLPMLPAWSPPPIALPAGLTLHAGWVLRSDDLERLGLR